MQLLIVGIWLEAEDDKPATYYRRTAGPLREPEEALPFMVGYNPTRPDVIALIQNDHMIREWRKGRDYGEDW